MLDRDLFQATTYVTPRRLCVAAAASSASSGNPGREALPAILKLIFHGRESPTFDDLLSTLRAVPFTPFEDGDGYSSPEELGESVEEPFGYAEGSPEPYGAHDVANDSDSLECDEDFGNARNSLASRGSEGRRRSALSNITNVADYLVYTVRRIDSPHALSCMVDTFFPPEDQHGTLIQGWYDRDGHIGVFLRKVSALYGALSFESSVEVYEAFRSYVRKGPSADTSTPQSLTQAFDPCKAANALANGRPVDSDEAFQSLLQAPQAKRVAANEFALHLEAVRRRDYSDALAHLHRYYDVSLAVVGHSRSVSAMNNATGAADEASAPAQGYQHVLAANGLEAKGHQYAALSLAALHFHFGHRERAEAAIRDAVRAAQQFGDDVCHSRALQWTARTCMDAERRHQLLRHGNDALALAMEELQTVITPYAREDNLRIALGVKPGTSFWDNDEQYHSSVSCARARRIQSRTGIEARDLHVKSLLVSAAGWEDHGSLTTARTVAQLALNISKRARSEIKCTSISRIEARATLAVALLRAKDGQAEAAISELHALAESSETAEMKPDFGIGQSSSRPEREFLQRGLTWLRFQRAVALGDREDARQHVETLESYAFRSATGSDLMNGFDSELDALNARAQWLLMAEDFDNAARCAKKYLRQAAACTRPARVVDGLRIEAHAQLCAGSHTAALFTALSALSISRGLGLETEKVKSVLLLVEIMLRMDTTSSRDIAHSARSALEHVLPRALEGAGMQVRGTARRLQAECILATEDSLATCYENVVNALEDGVSAFVLAEDRRGVCDCSYLLAHVHNESDRTEQRDCAAERFAAWYRE